MGVNLPEPLGCCLQIGFARTKAVGAGIRLWPLDSGLEGYVKELGIYLLMPMRSSLKVLSRK